MSQRLKDKLATLIRQLPRHGYRDRETQRHRRKPMKNESVTLAVIDSCAQEETNTRLASVEAVGRALGYTEKELLLAGDVLNRLVWRYPVSNGREKTLEAKVHKAA
jgi:hypothetical protein